ncbi:MAG: DUF512 domain-containing protein [Pygmaiobacter massiliensis]|nr:DUF512 domain-containing protein [Pygmaiobacter massiliensis]
MAIQVKRVKKGSAAFKSGLRAGCVLYKADDHELCDMLDYEFYTAKERFLLEFEQAGKRQSVWVQKGEYEPFGCDFETYLIDKQHSCKNKCIFCFVDQLPCGMRKSLYFKDDDERLSFLFGNYITLTNLSRRELDRIKQMHISPINVSVHTVDPALRVQMMKNRFAGNVLPLLQELAAAGIELNCQLVLCRGINDGAYLAQSMEELCRLFPAVQSVAAVPIGLTAYRDGLPNLTPYDKESAGAVIDQMEAFGEIMLKKHKKRIVYPSDEWYLQAGRPMPPASFYDGYPQLDNGVGMWRKFYDEFMDELEKPHRVKLPCRADTVTGVSAYPLIAELCKAAAKKYPPIRVRVHRVENRFFGGNVTVTGLLTGTDIIAQCEGRLKSRRLLLPSTTLRAEQDLFLDDISLTEFSQKLGVLTQVVPQDGGAFCRMLLGGEA